MVVVEIRFKWEVVGRKRQRFKNLKTTTKQMKKKRIMVALVTLFLGMSEVAFAHMYVNTTHCGDECSGTCTYSDSPADGWHNSTCTKKKSGCDC